MPNILNISARHQLIHSDQVPISGNISTTLVKTYNLPDNECAYLLADAECGVLPDGNITNQQFTITFQILSGSTVIDEYTVSGFKGTTPYVRMSAIFKKGTSGVLSVNVIVNNGSSPWTVKAFRVYGGNASLESLD